MPKKEETKQPTGVVGGLLPMLASSGGQFPFFKLEEGQRKRIRFLLTAEEGKAAMTHSVRAGGRFQGTFTCLGTSDCPGCERNDRPGYKGYIPVLDYESDMVGMMAGGKRLFGALAKLHQAFGDVRFRDVIVERTGKGFKTQYTIIPAVKKSEYTSIIESMDGDDIGDTSSVLLSGSIKLTSVPVDSAGIEIVKNVLQLEGVTASNLLEMVREPLIRVVEEIVSPPPVEQIEAMYEGRSSSGDGEAATEEADGGDFV